MTWRSPHGTPMLDSGAHNHWSTSCHNHYVARLRCWWSCLLSWFIMSRDTTAAVCQSFRRCPDVLKCPALLMAMYDDMLDAINCFLKTSVGCHLSVWKRSFAQWIGKCIYCWRNELTLKQCDVCFPAICSLCAHIQLSLCVHIPMTMMMIAKICVDWSLIESFTTWLTGQKIANDHYVHDNKNKSCTCTCLLDLELPSIIYRISSTSTYLDINLWCVYVHTSHITYKIPHTITIILDPPIGIIYT